MIMMVEFGMSIHGSGSLLVQVFATVWCVVRIDCNVLIMGESGIGKEVLVWVLYRWLPCCRGRMIFVNCGAIFENFFESEFFGHIKGAFIGVDRVRAGCFEFADKGTIFLDEIGEFLLLL